MGKNQYKSNKSPERSKKKLKKLKDMEEEKNNERTGTPEKEEKIKIKKSPIKPKKAKKEETQYINTLEEKKRFASEDDDEMMKLLEMDLEEEKKNKKSEKKKNKNNKKESAKKKLETSKTSQNKKELFSDNPEKPLEGKRLVITGLLRASEDRENIVDLVKQLGGHVTSAVSGKTDMVIYGYKLEDGRKSEESGKYKKALEKNTPLMSEEEFSEALKKHTGLSFKEHLTKLFAIEDVNEERYLTSFQAPQQKTSDKKIDLEQILEMEAGDQNEHSLWVDKYKPRKSGQIIGNKKQIQELKDWLKSKDKNKKKAVLISGPPGIGKTTVATIISKELGFDYVIKNASDIRNKKGVNTLLTVLSSNEILDKEGKLKKCVIIMDEVDGMKGDRGGITELKNQIKTIAQPIICICNDRQSNVMRDLAPICLDIKFKPPLDIEMMSVIKMIVSNEFNIEAFNQLDKNILQNVIKTSHHDIRQIITYLQMWLPEYLGQSDKNNGDILKLAGKDQFSFCNPFEATKIILNTKFDKNADFHDMKRYFFVDYNLMDQFIFENYLLRVNEFTNKNKKLRMKEKHDFLTDINTAIESIQIGDLTNKQIRQKNNYELLNELCFFSTIEPALAFERYVDFPQFPSTLTKLQSSKKRARLINELRDSYSTSTSIMSNSGVIDYSKTLADLCGSLMTQNKHEELFSLSQHYDLSPFKIKENLTLLMEFHKPDNLLKNVSASSKTKFTNYYSKKINSGKNSKSKKMKIVENDEEYKEEDFGDDSFIVDEDEFI